MVSAVVRSPASAASTAGVSQRAQRDVLMPLRVGVSGSRTAPTRGQRRAIRHRLEQLPPGTVLVVGACLGLDAYVARAALVYGSGLRVHAVVSADIRTVDWIDPDWRTWCQTAEQMPEGTTNRDRNLRLLHSRISVLLAWPLYVEADPRSQRSGTWQTIRLARRYGIPVEVVILSEILDT